jgi:two-component sensor histidine kinase
VWSAGNPSSLVGFLLAPRKATVGYAVAVAATLAAALLRWALGFLEASIVPFAVFYPAVLLAALAGGTGPGLLATVLSGALASWLFMGGGTDFPAFPSSTAGANLLVFSLSATMIVAVGAALRSVHASRIEMARVFSAVQELALDGVVIFRAIRDASGAIEDFERIYMNTAAERVLGSTKLMVGHSYLETSPTAQRDRLFRRYVDVMETGIPAEDEFRFETGQRWIFNVAARIDRDRLAITFRDITTLRETINQQKFLMRELNHRVKNVLTSVISLARQTATDKGVADYREALTARISAMARAHDLLMRESWETARVADIVAQTLAPYDRIFAHGPSLAVTADLALNLNMVLHELATNAAKYGALSDSEGHVEIRWDLASPGMARLVWRECDGPPVSPPSRKGFGSRVLLRGFNSDTRSARLDYVATGVQCTLGFEVQPDPSSGEPTTGAD